MSYQSNLRNLTFVLGLLTILFCGRAHAANCPIAAGSSQGTVQSTLNSCGSGNTAVFAAGTYSITSGLTWPCGVSITGPAVTVLPGPYGLAPAAVIDSSGYQGYAFTYPAGCSVTGVIFHYLEINGSNSDSNGGIQIGSYGAGGAGPDVEYNWIHGMQPNGTYTCGSAQCGGGTDNVQDQAIFVSTSEATNASTLSSSTWNNLTIANNRFGAGTLNNAAPGNGDCNADNLMQTFYYPYVNSPSQNNSLSGEYNNNGGYCGGVELGANTSNLIISNNSFFHLEEGIKFFEPGSNSGQQGCTGSYLSGAPNQYCNANSNVNANHFENIHRIAIEAQQTPNTTMNFLYGDWVNCLNCGYGSWIYSLPQDNNNTNCVGSCNFYSNADYNLLAGNQPQVTLYGKGGGSVPGFEFWGLGHMNYNLFQSNSISCGIHWGWTQSPAAFNYNASQGSMSNSCSEEGSSNTPSQTGNSSTGTIGALTSVAPTISPASGSFTTSQTVTFTNPGTNRDVNTGIWYTTDGSAPVPGSGTAQYIASGGTIAVSTTTTVKAVGMWGARTQPTSYPSGYGYVPSAAQSATYTAGTSSPTLNSVSLTAAGSVTSIAVGANVQISAACHYNNGTTTGCNTPDAYGNAVSTWNTSNAGIVTISSSGLAGGAAIGSANLAAVVAGVTSAAFSLGVTAPSVTLSSVTLATTGGITSIVAGSTNQLIATCHYSNGSTTTCTTADSQGNAVSTWTSSATTIATVSSGGVVTGVAAGSTNLSGVVAGITSSPLLTLTVTAAPPTLTGGYLGNTGSINTMTVGGTLQFSAYCQYSNSTTTNCSVPDIYGNGVTQWVSSSPSELTAGAVGSASPGLATAVSVGSPYIQAYVGAVHLNEWVLYISAPAVSLTGVSLATTGGVTALFVGYTTQLLATCTYSDGSTTNCTTTDSHGTVAGTYASSSSAHATVGASTGLVTGVAAGTTNFTAHAGSFTSSALPLSVLAMPSGTYTITITGPVTLSGTVHF